MSLMSRVRDIDDVPTLAASADDNALERLKEHIQRFVSCLLYTSDAADEL